MPYPKWLPHLFPLDTWSEDTYDRLYELFKNDFIKSQPVYDESPIWFFPEKEDGKEIVFWHLTSRDDKETGERLPDLRRSERLPWIRPMLEHSEQKEVLAWDHEEGKGEIKTYVWLHAYDFVVILKKYKDGRRRLLTAFFVEFGNVRRKLRKKYDRRINP